MLNETIRVAKVDIDPFYFYLQCVLQSGDHEVYLLDAAKDRETDTRYQLSILGLMPLLEVQVKDGCTAIYVRHGLDRVVQEVFVAAPRPAETPVFRPSAVGLEPSVLLTGDPILILEQLRQTLRGMVNTENWEPFSSGFLGYLGYDAVHYLESLPKTTVDDRHLPDIRLQFHAVTVHLRGREARVFSIPDQLIQHLTGADAFRLESLAQNVSRLVEVYTGDEPELLASARNQSQSPAEIIDDVAAETYMENVDRAREYIRAGDIFQVVLSKRMRTEARLHPYVAYDQLRKLNPSPYMFMTEYPDMRLFGASPEVQFRTVGGSAEMKPIAGTSRGRGRTPEEDAELMGRLLADEKERAEHVMLVDLCRNDLGRISVIGSVHVPQFIVVEPYSHLFHLVSLVRSRLRDDVSVFYALLATFPAGTLSGAPKIRAMEIIDELETLRRGPYGGLIGMVDLESNANTAIIIRSIVETEGQYYIQVGAGIVADSDPSTEWQECHRKAGALLDILSRPLTVQK
jgi:anthranilate synthase component 1